MSAITVPAEGRPDSLGEVELLGTDGNAFAIIGTVRRVLRRAGASPEFQTAFVNEASSGDYDHVIQTAMTYIEACGGTVA